MSFKVHDDLPIPGRGVSDSVQELVNAILKLKVGQCLEVDVQDLNWSERGPGYHPKREDVNRRFTLARRIISQSHDSKRRFAGRPIKDTSMGLWRLEDKE